MTVVLSGATSDMFLLTQALNNFYLVNDLIVKSSDHGVVSLLKEGKLVELHNEKSDNSFAVGDIYLGKANKVVQGLNAAFVDVGYEKDGFHYHDLGPQIRSFNKYVRKTISGRQHKYPFRF